MVVPVDRRDKASGDIFRRNGVSAQYARNVSLPIWSLAIKSVDICSSGVSMFLFAKR